MTSLRQPYSQTPYNAEQHLAGSPGNEWDGLVLKIAQDSLEQGTSHRFEIRDDIKIIVDVNPAATHKRKRFPVVFPSIKDHP